MPPCRVSSSDPTLDVQLDAEPIGLDYPIRETLRRYLRFAAVLEHELGQGVAKLLALNLDREAHEVDEGGGSIFPPPLHLVVASRKAHSLGERLMVVCLNRE